MSLIEIWANSPNQLRGKHVQQIIAFAGDGKLRDGGVASNEFREFLHQVPSGHLSVFTDECLTTRFDDSGLALQDVVNEIGRRLGFEVTDGRYRGNSKTLGFDGLWRAGDGHTVVVEVKTTDAYRIDLDTVANYRKALVRDGLVQEDRSSILLIVGRQDTGDLEAQIRGSRHAWDVRLISTDALRRLVLVKEEVEDPQTVRRISELLIPMEYTRLDGIVDLVFATASEVMEEDSGDPEVETSTDLSRPRQPKFIPVSFNQACADRIGRHLRVDLLRRSKATFASPDGKTLIICSVSKTHGEPDDAGFWFAFHPHQREALRSVDVAFVAFGCGSADTVLLIPLQIFDSWLPGLNMTRLPDREYWHVHIGRRNGKYTLQQKGGQAAVDLTEYLLRTSPGDEKPA